MSKKRIPTMPQHCHPEPCVFPVPPNGVNMGSLNLDVRCINCGSKPLIRKP